MKTFLKKVLDKPAQRCYNDYSKEREGTEMMNWYVNAELHDEDFEELEALMAEMAEEEDE